MKDEIIVLYIIQFNNFTILEDKIINILKIITRIVINIELFLSRPFLIIRSLIS